ncbi:hypothetical protein LCGC14_2201340 [marine sediment metagenome]|uniref:Uncharacterized protein n=1 Tax=marine sediment metagenome TaxID=412755 RepID=A0A0F9DGS8_9ZZZZ
MWLDKPPQDDNPALTPLLRPKSGQQIVVELTGDPLRVFVHYAAGRSWPCTGFSCTLCKRQIAKRFYAYYPCRGNRGGLGIVELTALAEAQLTKQMEPFSDFPCGTIKVSRPAGKKNMPCKVEWFPPDKYKQTAGSSHENNKQTGCRTPTEEELKESLMRIWNLPSMNGETEEREYLSKLNEIIRLKTSRRET